MSSSFFILVFLSLQWKWMWAVLPQVGGPSSPAQVDSDNSTVATNSSSSSYYLGDLPSDDPLVIEALSPNIIPAPDPDALSELLNDRRGPWKHREVGLVMAMEKPTWWPEPSSSGSNDNNNTVAASSSLFTDPPLLGRASINGVFSYLDVQGFGRIEGHNVSVAIKPSMRKMLSTLPLLGSALNASTTGSSSDDDNDHRYHGPYPLILAASGSTNNQGFGHSPFSSSTDKLAKPPSSSSSSYLHEATLHQGDDAVWSHDRYYRNYARVQRKAGKPMAITSIPLHQHLSLVTDRFEVAVSYDTRVEDYTRLPVPYAQLQRKLRTALASSNNNLTAAPSEAWASSVRVVSDFRAAGSENVKMWIWERLSPSFSSSSLFDAEEAARDGPAIIQPCPSTREGFPSQASAFEVLSEPQVVDPFTGEVIAEAAPFAGSDRGFPNPRSFSLSSAASTSPSLFCRLLLEARRVPHNALEFAYHAPFADYHDDDGDRDKRTTMKVFEPPSLPSDSAAPPLFNEDSPSSPLELFSRRKKQHGANQVAEKEETVEKQKQEVAPPSADAVESDKPPPALAQALSETAMQQQQGGQQQREEEPSQGKRGEQQLVNNTTDGEPAAVPTTPTPAIGDGGATDDVGALASAVSSSTTTTATATATIEQVVVVDDAHVAEVGSSRGGSGSGSDSGDVRGVATIPYIVVGEFPRQKEVCLDFGVCIDVGGFPQQEIVLRPRSSEAEARVTALGGVPNAPAATTTAVVVSPVSADEEMKKKEEEEEVPEAAGASTAVHQQQPDSGSSSSSTPQEEEAAPVGASVSANADGNGDDDDPFAFVRGLEAEMALLQQKAAASDLLPLGTGTGTDKADHIIRGAVVANHDGSSTPPSSSTSSTDDTTTTMDDAIMAAINAQQQVAATPTTTSSDGGMNENNNNGDNDNNGNAAALLEFEEKMKALFG
jgi:hypothetical protein